MKYFQNTAYLLVAHGSRDPRPQAAMNRLAHLVRERMKSPYGIQKGAVLSLSDYRSDTPETGLTRSFGVKTSLYSLSSRPKTEPPQPDPIVGTANLELGNFPLSQQIVDFGQRVCGAGIRRVRLAPLFLQRGVHVVEDIPAEVEQARQQLGKRLALEVCAPLGSHPGLKTLLQRKMSQTSADCTVLMAHGSRRPGGNRPVEYLAREMGLSLAFWSVQPELENQVVQAIQSGYQRIAVLPYFLFAGGITDAVTRLTEDLAERFPKISIRLLTPLGANPELAKLVADLVSKRTVEGSVTRLPIRRAALRY